MKPRLTLDEKLEYLKHAAATSRTRNVNLDSLDNWFFPSDIIPHSDRLKRICKALNEGNLLEREGDGTERWGYRYRLARPVLNKSKHH